MKFTAVNSDPKKFSISNVDPKVFTVSDFRAWDEVRIGTQIWMLRNWHIGGFVPYAAFRDIYGAFYSHAQAQALYVPGFHLPTNAEWNTLINYLGGAAIAGQHMKEIGLEHWDDPNVADNSSGFTALGSGSANNNNAYNLGAGTHFWSFDELGPGWPYSVQLSHDTATATLAFGSAGLNQYNVRLIKN